MYGADYDVVTIGEQTWMAKSMVRQDVENFCYKDMLGNCNDNDRFYKWEQAKDICPEGWQLPDSSEWQTLFDAVGGQENAGKVLKSIDGNGSNGVEFNALLAGYMNSMNQYKELDNKACYWVADGGGTKIVDKKNCFPPTCLADLARLRFIRCFRELCLKQGVIRSACSWNSITGTGLHRACSASARGKWRLRLGKS